MAKESPGSQKFVLLSEEHVHHAQESHRPARWGYLNSGTEGLATPPKPPAAQVQQNHSSLRRTEGGWQKDKGEQKQANTRTLLPCRPDQPEHVSSSAHVDSSSPTVSQLLGSSRKAWACSHACALLPPFIPIIQDWYLISTSRATEATARESASPLLRHLLTYVLISTLF